MITNRTIEARMHPASYRAKTRAFYLLIMCIGLLVDGCGGSSSGEDDEPSDNARLSGIDLIAGRLDQIFQSSQFDYTGEVSYLAASIRLTAQAEDDNASLSIAGIPAESGAPSSLVALDEGANTLVVEVTAEDESSKQAYTLEIHRQSLSSLAQQAFAKASNTEADDQFGYSIALDRDTLVVGAHREDSNDKGVNGTRQGDNLEQDAGAVYVIVRNGGVWSQQAYIKASNTQSGDLFGASVALDGDTLVIGAYRENSNATGINGVEENENAPNSGAVYVFLREGGVWSQQAYLKASNTGANDFFGSSIAVSGDTLAVGAINEDSGSIGVNGDQGSNTRSNSGAVYIFTRNDEIWSQQAYIKASNAWVDDWFGYSIALDGNNLAVGGIGESSNASGVNGNQHNDSMLDSGAAYLFKRIGGDWSQQTYIKASNPSPGDWFGYSVSLDGDSLAVGAPREDSGTDGVNGDQNNTLAPDAGAVYVFTRQQGIWEQEAYVKSFNSGGGDQFGYSVVLEGDTLAGGAIGENSSADGVNGDAKNDNALDSGAVYVLR